MLLWLANLGNAGGSAPAAAEERRGGAWLPDYKGQQGDRFKSERESLVQRREEIEELFAEAAGERRVPDQPEIQASIKETVEKIQSATKPKKKRSLTKQLNQLKEIQTKLDDYIAAEQQLRQNEQDLLLMIQFIEQDERQRILNAFTQISQFIH